jgi:hypothetical protein
MTEREEHHGAIGLGTALVLYGLLAAAAIYSLKGTALAVALLVVILLAVKSYVHHLRRRMDE